MRFVILAVSFAVAAQGASPGAAQRASVNKQRASVRKQVSKARPASLAAAWPTTSQWIAAPRAPRPAPAACSAITAPEVTRLVRAAAQANSIAPEIVREVARQESAFVPCAVSSAGAQGLMQLMPETADWLGVANPFDPEENMMAGARLLKDLLTRYNGNLALALSAYNAGPTRVDEANGVPAIAETQDYVERILRRLSSSGFTTGGFSGLLD